MKRLYNNKTGKQIKVTGTTAIPYVDLMGKHVYVLTTAITTGVTAPPAGSASGDFVVTTNATGRNSLYYSNGSNLVAAGDGGAGFTQGASVADPAALTAAALTDNSAGTANTTLEALTSGTTYSSDVAAIRNNFADLAAMENKHTVDIGVVRTQLIALITSLENAGILVTV